MTARIGHVTDVNDPRPVFGIEYRRYSDTRSSFVRIQADDRQEALSALADHVGNTQYAVTSLRVEEQAEPAEPEFFQAGHTYQRRRWMFQCLAVAPEPFRGELRAVGFLYREGENATVTGMNEEEWADAAWVDLDLRHDEPQHGATRSDGTEYRVLITRAKLYPEVARPGPAWQWSYNYFVNGGPVCQYGPGLTSLRRMLREKFGRNVEIVKAWETRDAEAPKSART